jgi:NAD(P)H-quinone oxidoreductase subunit 4
MDVLLALATASTGSIPLSPEVGTQAGSFPWLSLIVLLPAAGALLMPLLPGDGDDPRAPRALALGTLLILRILNFAVSPLMAPLPSAAVRRRG